MNDKTTSLGARFVATPGKTFRLADRDPGDSSAFKDKDKAKAQASDDAAAIDALQDRLYAESRRSLLVVLQGIDCAGKDGTIRSVFNTCGPIGVRVSPFKAPVGEELAHDYLWRVHQTCPARGYIGIFNRSHYEDVLVVKVRKFASPEAIERRYGEINAFEKLLSDSGTRILKFMLHISRDVQATRLQERLDDPKKHWKFNPADLDDRLLWDDYMAAYEMAVTRCSTPDAPWYVIPANHHWVRNAAIARITREALEEMNPQYPEPTGWDPKSIRIV
jgi:PPK2 family polyphosphate:nucleotide phosphotransferase